MHYSHTIYRYISQKVFTQHQCSTISYFCSICQYLSSVPCSTAAHCSDPHTEAGHTAVRIVLRQIERVRLTFLAIVSLRKKLENTKHGKIMDALTQSHLIFMWNTLYIKVCTIHQYFIQEH